MKHYAQCCPNTTSTLCPCASPWRRSAFPNPLAFKSSPARRKTLAGPLRWRLQAKACPASCPRLPPTPNGRKGCRRSPAQRQSGQPPRASPSHHLHARILCNTFWGQLRQQQQQHRSHLVIHQGAPAQERRPNSVRKSRFIQSFRCPPAQPCCRSSNGSPIDNIVSDTAAQLLFDKENHISQLVVQTGAKQCVDICNPEATKSLNARDKLKVQSKIEVGCGRLVVCLVTVFLCWCRTAYMLRLSLVRPQAMQRQMNQLLEQLQAS